MARTSEMFAKPTRAKPRVMMHFEDLGHEVDLMAKYACKCGHNSGWVVTTAAEIRRGIPCPKCNPMITPGDTHG